MDTNKDIQNLLKDFKNLQNKLERYSKSCETQISDLEDGEMKSFLSNSYKKAISGNLDIDTFLKELNKCQQQ
jgi:hypothetical protein